MAVAKIDAHQPDVLLVEKSVSRYAQEYLLAKDISLVLNIKRPLLERIARCTGAQIVPSIDHLSSQKLGYSDMFHVTRFQEEHGSAGQDGKKLVKTLMYFEGCPKPFGCTVSHFHLLNLKSYCVFRCSKSSPFFHFTFLENWSFLSLEKKCLNVENTFKCCYVYHFKIF